MDALTVLVHTGLLVYPNGVLLPGTAPWWILALWVLFAVQFNVLFGWLKSRLWLAAILGAIAGPLSFRGGAALGAVSFPHPAFAFAALAAGWAVLMPLMLAFARHWDGVHVTREA